MKKILTTALLASVIIFSACEKDTPTPATPTDPNAFNVSVNGKIVNVKNLPADTIIAIGATGPYGAGIYSYFSLETNSKVSIEDSTSSNWDLAFAGTTIRVNNGTSGPGNGGAFVYTGTFDALTTVPVDSTFRVDNAPAYAITKASGKGWYNYDAPNNLITAIPGRVLVIRTASGKYAKVEILNYYKGGVTPATTASDDIKSFDSRYYTFRYTYQSNGTTTF